MLVGPQNKYLNFPGYFFYVLMAMVKYRGRFEYMVWAVGQGNYLNSPGYFSNVLLVRNFTYMVRGVPQSIQRSFNTWFVAVPKQVLKLSRIHFLRIIGDGKVSGTVV